MKKVLFGFIILALAGCISAKLLTPTQRDVDRVQAKFPNYTLSELNQGKHLFEQNCKTCHGLKNPTSRSEEKWREIVPVMVKKVNRKETVLSAHDEELILRFLITMSGASKSK